MTSNTEFKIEDRAVYVLSYARTPIGSFNGSLSTISAPKLGSIAIKSALTKANISPKLVNEVIFGNVLQSNLGQNPARQASIYAGIPNTVPATSVNKICSSGMKAISLGCQSIQLGLNDIVVAGGMENMSQSPYYLEKHRFGKRMGHSQIIDGMIKDGLWDVYSNQHMGTCAELCAKEFKISRKEQDEFSILSYKRAQSAHKNGIFNKWKEITPVEVPQRKGNPIIISEDEGISKLNESKLKSLRGLFPLKDNSKEATVTAGNASPLSDGAAAVILISGKKYKELKLYETNIKPKCIILSYSDSAHEPERFPVAPSKAIPLALKRCNLSLSDLNNNDWFEINEAFAVAALANAKLLNIPIGRINIFGGAVALGHPLGCSGARILCTLITTLKEKKGRYGVAGICNGGGGASSIVIKNI